MKKTNENPPAFQEGFYMADATYGVSFAGESAPTGDVWKQVNPATFRDSLTPLKDDEYLYAYFGPADAAVLEQIEREFGFH